MLVYNIVTGICLALMAVFLLSFVCKIALTYKRKQREERIQYLRDFKKGRMVLIYIFVFPLLLAGLIYEGKPFFNALTGAMATVIDIVVLKFDPSGFSALMGNSKLFEVSIYISYALIAFNACMFVWSIAGQYISNVLKKLAVKMSKDKVVIFGNNENSLTIYNSEKDRRKIVIDQVKGDDATALYMKNIVYGNVNSNEEYIGTLVKNCIKHLEEIDVVINTESDERNIEIARLFATEISKLDNEDKGYVFEMMRVFVFGDPRFETIYEDIVASGFGCISYVNKYQKMAVDFIDKYPYTRFMSAKHIDYATSCVKEGVEINAIMIGFGNTNRQIFLTSVAGNQFIKQGANGVELQKVKYHIFDKSFKDKDDCQCKCDANNKNLNHNYFRFKNECENIVKENYLPLPDYPAEENFHHLDVNDQDFYNQIRTILTRSKQDANFIIIAFGGDLENIDMAEKLLTKTKEWGVDNTNIFVKTRSVQGKAIANDEEYHPICCEEEVVYNMANITGDKLQEMSMMRDAVYALEYEVSASGKELTETDLLVASINAHRGWYMTKTSNERESNIYCALSLRSKLNMMGLDYCSVYEDGKAIDEKAYLEIYAGNDMPDTTAYPFTVGGKPIVKYTLDFKKSRRGDMAIHEHYRWNSFMITKGFIPATKDTILTEYDEEKCRFTNGKNYTLRRHGNLTTFDGLIEFRKMVAERDRKQDEALLEAEARKDVIKYDYQLLDDAHWLLTNAGFKIIARNK